MIQDGVTAIVPMRHSSERVIGKNYRLLGGKPLYHHVVEALLGTPGISEVIIDTDSDLIFGDAKAAFPEVRLVERPAHLRDGHTPMNEVLANTLTHVSTDVVLQTHSTNPFVLPRSYQNAIDRYFSTEDCDSVFGVTRIQGRLWTQDLQAVNHDPAILARTQDLPPVFLENSCFYVFSKGSFASSQNRIGSAPQVVEIDPIEATDIDEEVDFSLAEAIESSTVRPR